MFAIKKEFLQDVENLGGPLEVTFSMIIEQFGDKPVYSEHCSNCIAMQCNCIATLHWQLSEFLKFAKDIPIPSYVRWLQWHQVTTRSEQTRYRILCETRYRILCDALEFIENGEEQLGTITDLLVLEKTDEAALVKVETSEKDCIADSGYAEVAFTETITTIDGTDFPTLENIVDCECTETITTIDGTEFPVFENVD